MTLKLANEEYDVYSIPIFDIWIDEEFNCRYKISRHSVEELMESIEKEGLYFPVVVQPIEDASNAPKGFKWKLICGFRRYHAMKYLGKEVIPANIKLDMDHHGTSILNLVENIERKNPNVLEEAKALDNIYKSYRTNRSIAKELNKSTSWVQVRRRLINLSPFIQDAAASGRLTISDLKHLQFLKDADARARQIIAAGEKGPDAKNKLLRRVKKHARPKAEVKEMIAKMLDEGFSPQMLRLMGWCIGEVTDEQLQESLDWLRDRKGWLK